MKDDDQWSEEYQPFLWETNMAEVHRQEVEAANAAVKEALEAYKAQKWYHTLWARLRFALFWLTYWPREKFALSFTAVYCRLTGKESRLVSPKVWHRLGI